MSVDSKEIITNIALMPIVKEKNNINQTDTRTNQRDRGLERAEKTSSSKRMEGLITEHSPPMQEQQQQKIHSHSAIKFHLISLVRTHK